MGSWDYKQFFVAGASMWSKEWAEMHQKITISTRDAGKNACLMEEGLGGCADESRIVVNTLNAFPAPFRERPLSSPRHVP